MTTPKMDGFWASVMGASGASGACNTLQQNSQGYDPIGDEKIICNGINAPLAPPAPLGADPYDQAERLAIQQEGNEISDLPDKPILSLAEQAALVLDGYNGGIGLLVSDLRTVAHNFVLAAYLEAGNATPQPILAQTTPMTPDRGFDDVPGFAGLPDLTPSEHGAILARLELQGTTCATAAPTMQPESVTGPYGAGVVTDHPDGSMTIRYLPDMKINRPPAPPPAPATVTCGSCAEFESGKTPLGIGMCSRTLDGLPPIASRGYGACYPDAPRRCPDFRPMENPQ